MKSILIKTKLFFAFVLFSCSAQAQTISIFPEMPFDFKLAIEKGYSKAVVRVGHYEKSETDESGYTWSIPKGEDYQCARYSFFNGQMEFETHYNPNGDKYVSWQYYYRDGLLSVIDELSFDSTQVPVPHYSCVYHYDAQSNPFQKVIQFQSERNFRLLYDYTFDTERRPVREKISTTGQLQKWENLNGLVPGRQEQMTLVEYRSDVKTTRIYENSHKVVEIYNTVYDLETRLPQRLELQNASRTVQWLINYDYEGDKLTLETRYRVGEVPEPELESKTYYLYDSDELLERKIIESGNQQTIYSYTYFAE